VSQATANAAAGADGAAGADSIFVADGASVVATVHARGPWDPGALHGGAPAALIVSAFERIQPGAELSIARLSVQFLRPIPTTPLVLSTTIVRPGRRVQELTAELREAGEPPGEAGGQQGEVVCRASALRVLAVPAELPDAALTPELNEAAGRGHPMGTPEQATPLLFALDDSSEPSFASSAMEMRALGDPRTLGPGRVWMRLRHPLLPDQPLTPLARLAATADFGNGISASLPFDRYLFINADLTIQLQRHPRGEWIGLDARTVLHEGGTGLAESVLYDVHGPVGRAFQTLVVQAR
jgi:acyl-coenzyme A thioesterase PaaI-like protein